MAEESVEERKERAKSSTSQKELEKLAEDKDNSVLMCAAESICEHLGDKTWAKKIYKQIEDNAEDSFSSEKKNKCWRLNYG